MKTLTLIITLLIITIQANAQTLTTTQYIRTDGIDTVINAPATLTITEKYVKLELDSDTLYGAVTKRVVEFDELRLSGCKASVLAYVDSQGFQCAWIRFVGRKWYLERGSEYIDNRVKLQ